MKKHALKKAKQSPFAGDDLTPTVFVYNEHGINGTVKTNKDGVTDPMNEINVISPDGYDSELISTSNKLIVGLEPSLL